MTALLRIASLLPFVAMLFPAPLAAAPPADFVHTVAPILKKHCAKCHTNGTYKGSFSLDTRATTLEAKTAVVPGKPAESELIERITSEDPDLRMPPEGKRLTAAEIDVLKTWIADGAAWPETFSFKTQAYQAPLALRRVSLPPATAGLEHPIDRIVSAYLREHGLSMPPLVDDLTFARRIWLDLVGLLPPLESLDVFIDAAPREKRGLLVARLLDDRTAYADHWLTFWNDLLRNDYKGVGYTDGGRMQITYWLYQALLGNMPYNRFVHELVSPPPGSDAAGFDYGIKWRGRVNASQTREIQFSQNVSLVFFGINMKCASCHDSFIDRWKLDDAYGLAAVIADEPLEIYRCDKATGKFATPHFLWPELGSIDPKASKPERLAQLADLITSRANGRFARTIVNRIWQRLVGRGIVHPVDVMANRPWSEDLLEYLAVYLVEHNYDLKRLMEHIVTSRTYQSQAATADAEPDDDDYVFRGPEVKRMTAEQFIDAVWTITGTAPAKPVARIDAPLPPPVPRNDKRSEAALAAAKPAATKKVAKKPPIAELDKLPNRMVRAALVNSDLLMRSLGRPNREQTVTTRSDLLTTLEALDLSNGAIMADLVERGAGHFLVEAAGSTHRVVTLIYWQALSRAPTDSERQVAEQMLGPKPTAAGIADLLWTIFMLPEFQLIR